MSENNFIHPESLSIDKIFEDNRYIVPIYQRNYAWGQHEIEQLLTDIDDISDLNYSYYLGSLIVKKRGDNQFEVIDGQQRLTTLFLILAYLNHDSINGNKSVSKGYLTFEARKKSNETLKYLVDIDEFDVDFSNDNWYSVEIIRGYKVIQSYFKSKVPTSKNGQNNEPLNDKIEKFKEKLKQVVLIRTEVPKGVDLNHYFEVMNTRGEQLELHEIAKAKLLSVLNSPENQEIAATIWDACASMNTYVQMNFKPEIRKKLFDENWNTFKAVNFGSLKEAFKNEDASTQKSDSAQESNHSKSSAIKKPLKSILSEPWKYNFEDKNTATGEENERFESIISFPNFLLQVNCILNKNINININDGKVKVSSDDNEESLDDKLFLSSLSKYWESEEKAEEFIFALLKYRFLFDKFIIKREYLAKYGNEGRWSLLSLHCTKDGNDKNKPSYGSTFNNKQSEDDENNSLNQQLKLLESCLRVTYTSPKTMHWIGIVLGATDKFYTDKNISELGEQLISFLEDYCNKKVHEANYETSTGFVIARIVFTYLDYILWQYHQDAFNNGSENKKIFEFTFRNSIEHFYPQNPANKVKLSDEVINKIGNLALISVSDNAKFSNLLPSDKLHNRRAVFETPVENEKNIVRIQSPKLTLMGAYLEKEQEWDKNQIEEQTKEMHKYLKDKVEKNSADSNK